MELTPNKIRQMWDATQEELRRVRADYWLNLAYLEGYHKASFDLRSSTLNQAWLSPDYSQVNERANLFRANAEVLFGSFLRSTIHYQVPSPGADDSSITCAKLAERVLHAAHSDGKWESLRRSALVETLLGGTAAVCVDWDPDAESLSFDPGTGQPTDVGEVRLDAVSIAEFGLSPGANTQDQANWMIRRVLTSPEIICETYGLSKVDPDASSLRQGLDRQLAHGRPNINDLAAVLVCYVRPHRKSKGRVVHLVNDKIVHSEAWPYGFDHLPAYVFRASPLSNRWFSSTFLSEARPLQRVYNEIRSRTLENHRNASAPYLFTPIGSLVDGVESITDLSGQIIQYDPTDGGSPHWLSPPDSTRSTRDLLMQVREDLDDVMHVHDLTRGQAPGDRNSGAALSILAEKDETPLGLIGQDQAEGWGHIGRMILSLYAANAEGSRRASVRLAEGVPPTSVPWSGAQFRALREVHVPLESTRATNHAARQAQVLQLADRFPQMFEQMRPAEILRMFDLPADSLTAGVDADAAKASIENYKMAHGDVQTPASFDDHAAHMSMHNHFRTTLEYQTLPEDLRLLIDLHIEAHQRYIEEEVAAQRQLNQMEPGLGGMPQANRPIGAFQAPVDRSLM